MNSNTTGDLYHLGNSPPAAPDLAALPLFLHGDYGRYRMETGASRPATLRFTHVALMDAGTDVRDGFSGGTTGGNADAVYIPDRTGTRFDVVFVERQPDGSRRVYLNRRAPAWPTNEV